MALSDGEIKKRIRSGKISIVPFDEACVQPASYDLHLSNQFKVYSPHRSEIIDPKKGVDEMMEDIVLEDGRFFVLHPGSFALGLIAEKTGVDSKHLARLEGKSSLARLGLIIHTTAGYLDPGNNLKLTLELFNASPLPIKLYPGMKIAQIAFEEMDRACEKPYGSPGLGSKYYNDESIETSKMHLNFDD